MNKRDFLRAMGGGAASMMFGPDLTALFARYRTASAAELAPNEEFWDSIRAKFTLNPDYINLENGYYCFLPDEVLEQFISHVRTVNYQGSRYMRTSRVSDKLRVRTKLAAMGGCSPDELIITRNATESLDTVIAGFDWKPGDEAITSNHDYGAMIDMFKLQARRYGMTNRFIDIPIDPRSDDEVVQVYARAMTPKTRLLMIPHLVNITGHVLPVRAICDMAHARGAQVLVDGAHAFAHLDFKLPDLDCDYYGSSLHKWLCAPLGAGLLYVRKDRIKGLWPIYGEEGVADTDIMKLNHTGTHPVHGDLGLENAIAFHEAIGGARKAERLRWVQNYWTSRVRGTPRIVLNTPRDPQRSCGIANVGIEGMTPNDLAKTLMEKHRIFTVAINNPGAMGVRVTPQIYTSVAELDAFVKALKAMAA
jgi:selenocysteine lyase/cysteine desulfurase